MVDKNRILMHELVILQKVYDSRVNSCNTKLRKTGKVDTKFREGLNAFLEENAKLIVSGILVALGPLQVPHSYTVLPYLLVRCCVDTSQL